MPLTRTMIAGFGVTALAALASGCAPERPGSPDTAGSATSATITPSPTATAAPAPSFDCAKLDPTTAHEAEKLVCNDPQLAALDRRLAAEYTHADAQAGQDRATLEAAQRGWVAGRDDCWKADDMRRCVVEAYRTRLVELKVDDPDTVVPPTVTYQCPGDKACSGSKYGRDGVEFWEHQGEVSVDFFGNEFVCKTT